MHDQEEIQEWVKVSRSAQRVVVVTVSLVQGPLSAKWSEKVLDTTRVPAGTGRVTRPDIKPALKLARASAREILDDTRRTLEELDKEDSEAVV